MLTLRLIHFILFRWLSSWYLLEQCHMWGVSYWILPTRYRPIRLYTMSVRHTHHWFYEINFIIWL